MSVAYEEFFPEVLPFVTGCPEPVAINAIRNACIEFCRGSQVWQYDHDPISAIANHSEYPFFLPDDSWLSAVLTAKYDGNGLTASTLEELDDWSPSWRTLTGTPSRYYLIRTDDIYIRLVHMPDETKTNVLNCLLALEPTLASTDVEDIIYYDYRRQIGLGALAYLMEMPGKPWTNDAKAREKMAYFKHAVKVANFNARRAFTRRAETATFARHW